MGIVEFYDAKDELIWDRFREGDSNAFEIIYERNINTLTNYGRRLSDDDELVKDAIHDVFIDLWRRRQNLGPTNSIKFYLIKAYRRNLVKKIVTAKRFDSHDEKMGTFDGAFQLSHEISIIESEIEESMLTQLNDSLNKLPERQKEALFLRFFAGLNYTEISGIMEVNQQSAYNMVFRGLEILRKRMSINLVSLLVLLMQLSSI